MGSLLILLPKEKIFLHMDSLGDTNWKHATALALNLLLELEEDISAYNMYPTYDPDEIKQNNCFDSGIYILQFSMAAQYHFCGMGDVFENFHPMFRNINSQMARKEVLQGARNSA